MGARKKQYDLSREEIIEMLKLELEREVNATIDELDKPGKAKNGYEYEQIMANGVARFTNKWMYALAGMAPMSKNQKKASDDGRGDRSA